LAEGMAPVRTALEVIEPTATVPGEARRALDTL